MGILIGMDEAGYGPNLGPLVVAATAWRVDDGHACRRQTTEGTTHHARTTRGSAHYSAAARIKDAQGARYVRSDAGTSGTAAIAAPAARPRASGGCVDLYPLLRNIVAKSASERRIAIADSKVLYRPGLGLRQLERGVHVMLLALQQSLACWSELVRYCDADRDGHHLRACWPDGHDCRLPIDAGVDEISRLAARFARACEGSGVRPQAIRARLVFPEQFNELVSYYNSKGAALSHVTVDLLRGLMDELCRPAAGCAAPLLAVSELSPVYVVCDKHGGRNFYTALLQHHFSEHWIEPVYESQAESRYEWGPPESRVTVTFRTNGERFLPTALASMTAKYLRELAMRAFNEFWCARVPGLAPTAGYPVDSHRFRKAIAAAQRELGIDDDVLWRKR